MGTSYFLIQKCMPGTKVSCFSVDFPFVLAPCGFVRLCEAFGGIARLWPLGSSGRLWKALPALQGFVRLWKALLGSLERLRKALGGFVT